MTPEVAAERRVLVVEDEPDLRELLTYNLEAAGFTVHAADKGLDGLAEAQGFAPDIILLDNMTPAQVKVAVKTIAGQALVEVSGGVRFETLRDYALAGVDIISVGALTHSVAAADLSLDLKTKGRK